MASFIKELLPKTYFPFLGHFPSLTEVQTRTIPEIIKSQNVLVVSPSASGKTESVVAPLIEKALKKSRQGLQILYISPTRALVNDLFRRLVYPLELLGLSIDLKTGDYPEINEQKLPFLLLTTPESFDSLLCRHPKIFFSLSGIILDELHLLHNTPRGDQLRLLLTRLRRILGESSNITQTSLGYAALSATIDDLSLARYYFPRDSEISVISVSEKRRIEYQLFPEGEGLLEELISYFLKNNFQKILWFFNARSLAEQFLVELKRISCPYPILIHHASLSKKEREAVEHFMNTEKRCILLSTSTLELGIDIGDIDCVVHYRPPFNVSSFLQRIGRGNRRNNERLFTVGIYRSNFDKIIFEVFLECAEKGKLFERSYKPCFSVLPQQLFSYAYQRRRIGLTLKAWENMTENYLEEYPEVKRKVFNHLIQTGYLKELRGGIYFLTEKLEKKIDYGKIHSNIQEKSFGVFKVYNAETNAFLGSIYYLSERFILGGRTYEVLRVEEKEKKVWVRYLKDASGTTKVFEGTGALGYHYRMVPLLIKRLFPFISQEGLPYFIENQQVHIIHMLGGLYSSLLSAALKKEGWQVIDLESVIFIIPQKFFTGTFPLPTIPTLREIIEEKLLMLEDNLGSGAYLRFLPKELQIEDHYRALDLDGLVRFLESQALIEISPYEGLFSLD
jgi:ATP-dependent Lhr-like helicase